MFLYSLNEELDNEPDLFLGGAKILLPFVDFYIYPFIWLNKSCGVAKNFSNSSDYIVDNCLNGLV